MNSSLEISWGGGGESDPPTPPSCATGDKLVSKRSCMSHPSKKDSVMNTLLN